MSTFNKNESLNQTSWAKRVPKLFASKKSTYTLIWWLRYFPFLCTNWLRSLRAFFATITKANIYSFMLKAHLSPNFLTEGMDDREVWSRLLFGLLRRVKRFAFAAHKKRKLLLRHSRNSDSVVHFLTWIALFLFWTCLFNNYWWQALLKFNSEMGWRGEMESETVSLSSHIPVVVVCPIRTSTSVVSNIKLKVESKAIHSLIHFNFTQNLGPWNQCPVHGLPLPCSFKMQCGNTSEWGQAVPFCTAIN